MSIYLAARGSGGASVYRHRAAHDAVSGCKTIERKIRLQAIEAGVQRSTELKRGKPLVWYRKAADRGNAGAQFNLGDMYYHGRGIAQDTAQAIVWYRKAAEQGIARAQYVLGTVYYYDQGRDSELAAAWFRNAAEQGLADAQYNLGILYFKGDGVAQDDAQAVFWLRKAAQQGQADARVALHEEWAAAQP
jgi:TPR repeat protein